MVCSGGGGGGGGTGRANVVPLNDGASTGGLEGLTANLTLVGEGGRCYDDEGVGLVRLVVGKERPFA